MDCYCQIDAYDDCGDCGNDNVATYRKARKKHLCEECGRTIVPGEKYERFIKFYDGSVYVYKTCLDCISVRDVLFCSWIFGQIWEDVRGQIIHGNIPEACITKLTKGARDKVCDMIDEWYEDIDDD